ncbi:IctB family putative bicarbonate transporter [Candidatus Cyanaurora vandensis]|uniref:IctB family putative bicarbonate transporter n=1 Tax=Candidatus Cyanaurora vandensis TaxID=2714958 RepID=UPI00257D97B9|nr:IctB family putative bicarbonate transporter [Candidatus Cyanaurora vandensis]
MDARRNWFRGSLLLRGLQGLSLWAQDTRTWATAGLLTSWAGQGRGWTARSWLCRGLDGLALGWAVVLFAVAPYVSTGIIGAILAGGTVLWLVMVLTRPLQLTPITLAVLAFWGLTTVAALCSPVLATSAYGWGLVTLYLVGYALLSRVLQTHRDWVVAVYLLTVAIVGVEGLRQWQDGAVALATWVDQESPLKDTTRIYSYLGNPNLLAAYLLPAVSLGAVAVLVWSRWWARVLAAAVTVLAVVCIGLTYSRGGWLALGLMGLVGLALALCQVSARVRAGLVGGAVGIVALAVAFIPGLQVRLASIFVGRDDSSNNFRITVWDTVWQMVQDYFWLGIGPGNRTFETIYPYYQRAGYNALGAYSVPLETWVELGVVGLVVSLWLVVVVWGWAVGVWLTRPSPERWWAAAALLLTVGLMVQGLFDTVWYRPQVQMLWWLGIALINSLTVPKD